MKHNERSDQLFLERMMSVADMIFTYNLSLSALANVVQRRLFAIVLSSYSSRIAS